jgi:putative transferase (TIGR04331 family)
MSIIKRYLITTDDERTWKFDQPVIFLGEWCRQYHRKELWGNMDGVVAAPYGLGQQQKDSDYDLARSIEERLFPVVCRSLNTYHGTSHDARYWRIVLGHWLRRFVEVILNRVNTLEQCLLNHELSGVSVFPEELCDLAAVDSEEATWLFHDSGWNNVLYGRILACLETDKCPLDVLPFPVRDDAVPVRSPQITLKKRMLRLVYERVGRLAELFVRDDDALIVNTYLPRVDEIRFFLALRQVPQLWINKNSKDSKRPDKEGRKDLSRKWFGDVSLDLYGIVCTLLFEVMPVCFLEGYAEISEKAERLPWPKNPRYILTGNNFDTDELFKLFTAKRVGEGVKYFVLQHGNNYGTHRYMNPSVEEETSDGFLTWGWSDGLPQHLPAFIVKKTRAERAAHDPDGNLLLIENLMYHRVETWDNTYEFTNYFPDQVRFIENLDGAARANMTLRVHPYYVYLNPYEVERWREYDENLDISPGGNELDALISKSRLVAHAYDSTGILETLALNVPSIAFWRGGDELLRDSAKKYYKLLVAAGIIHYSSESAAKMVNNIWDDVAGWWNQQIVQDARKEFCERYAKISRNPVGDLRRIIEEQL